MPFVDKTLGDIACSWFRDYFYLTKGEWAGKEFKLLPWQENEVIRPLFSTLKSKEDRYRQYNTVYIEIPKKNGKSPLGAAIALILLFLDKENGAEVYSAASDRNQAAIVFDIAAQMVRLQPEFYNRCTIVDSTKRIVHDNHSVYRVLSSEAFSKAGYNISGCIFDELHTQPNRELYDVLTKGAGDARRQPLWVFLTTAGYDRFSICYEVHEYALRVKNDPKIDPTFLPVIYAADPNADWKSEKTWYSCNPSLGKIIDIQKVRNQCKEAIETPANENTFKRLRLNIWTEAQTRWITSEKWSRCNIDSVDPEKLKGRPCYGGLDLSSILDISAWTLCFPPIESDEVKKYQFLHMFFIPSDNMAERERRDKVSYSAWIRQGLVTATHGSVIDYSFIEDRILKDAKTYNIREIALDPYNARSTITKLQGENMIVIELRQGYLTMSPMAKDFEVKVLAGELAMGNNPIMNWMIGCTEITTDPAGNIKPVKPDRQKTGKRIDGIISSIMSLSRATANESPDSIYKKRGVVVIGEKEEKKEPEKAEKKADKRKPETPIDSEKIHKKRYNIEKPRE